MPTPLLILFTFSSLVQAGVLLAVARTLERRARPRSVRWTVAAATLFIAGPVATLWAGALPAAPAAGPISGPDLAVFVIALALVPLMPLLTVWLAWRDMIPVCLCVAAFPLTIAVAILVAPVALISAWIGGAETVGLLAFAAAPLLSWHVVSGSLLFDWARSIPLPTGLCRQCQYDVSGLPPENPCPECGAAFPQSRE